MTDRLSLYFFHLFSDYFSCWKWKHKHPVVWTAVQREIYLWDVIFGPGVNKLRQVLMSLEGLEVHLTLHPVVCQAVQIASYSKNKINQKSSYELLMCLAGNKSRPADKLIIWLLLAATELCCKRVFLVSKHPSEIKDDHITKAANTWCFQIIEISVTDGYMSTKLNLPPSPTL